MAAGEAVQCNLNMLHLVLLPAMLHRLQQVIPDGPFPHPMGPLMLVLSKGFLSPTKKCSPTCSFPMGISIPNLLLLLRKHFE